MRQVMVLWSTWLGKPEFVDDTYLGYSITRRCLVRWTRDGNSWDPRFSNFISGDPFLSYNFAGKVASCLSASTLPVPVISSFEFARPRTASFVRLAELETLASRNIRPRERESRRRPE